MPNVTFKMDEPAKYEMQWPSCQYTEDLVKSVVGPYSEAAANICRDLLDLVSYLDPDKGLKRDIKIMIRGRLEELAKRVRVQGRHIENNIRKLADEDCECGECYPEENEGKITTPSRLRDILKDELKASENRIIDSTPNLVQLTEAMTEAVKNGLGNLPMEKVSRILDDGLNNLSSEAITKAVENGLRNLPTAVTQPSPVSASAPKPARTYASMVSATGVTPTRPVTAPAILVSSKSKDSTKEATVKSFSAAVKFRNLDFAPSKIQPLSNNKIRVEFDCEEHRVKTLECLEKCEQLAVANIKHLKPMVILKGVSKEIPKEELTEILLRQNPAVRNACEKPEDFTLRFIRKNQKDQLYNAVFLTSPKVFRAIMDLTKLCVDYLRVHAQEFSPFLQCYKCLQFGHTRKHCSSETAVCSHCAGKHELERCPVKDDRSKVYCFNCITHNQKYNGNEDVKHLATAVTCPRVKAISRKVAQRIDYGVNP